MKTKIGLLIGLLILGAAVFGYLQYNKPHKDIEASNTFMTASATELIKKFEDKTIPKSEELLNKILLITGTITALEQGDQSTIIILNDGVKCEFLSTVDDRLGIGKQITVKGVYVGFDELFNEITLAKCIIPK